MATPRSILIVGGGLAGATTAFALRKRGFAGRLAIVGEEDSPPYERPPLSKTYLRAESPLAEAYVRDEDAYPAQEIELLRGRRAVSLDPARRRVTLDDGMRREYGALVLATGAAPRQLEVPGRDLEGVRTLRTAADADAIRVAATGAGPIAVIGGGWIGSEVAASLSQLGHPVTMVMSRERPLEHVLGPDVAEAYRAIHLEHGNQLVRGRVTALVGRGRIEGVQLGDGQVVPADLVVVGIGATPRIELAAGAGLTIADDGIAVDEHLRAAPGIYVVGDVAAAWHPRYGRRVRVEHWDNAIRQGRAVAATIMGGRAPYERVPYFYSDQFDLGMEYRGFAPRWDQVVVRGDLPGRAFLAFWLLAGHVVAAMNANRWDDADTLERMVAADRAVAPERLADAAAPLEDAA